jgi:quercetin dioxygenase-like cupin family protein
MKKLCILAGIVALVAVYAGSASAQKKMKMRAPIFWAAEDIKWEALKDGPPGVMVATLWGDFRAKKGLWGALVKLPAGFDMPLHFHTNDFKAVVISGTFVHEKDGKEQLLGAGSYMDVPGGDQHISRVTKDAPCVLFQEGMGMWDVVLVGEKR